MKRKFFQNRNPFLSTIRISCAAAVGLMVMQAQAGQETTTESAATTEAEEEEEEFANHIALTLGGISIDDSDAAFKRRTNLGGDFFGGIESMRWQQDIGDITWMTEGHLLFGTQDYDITLGATKQDLGYLKGGFRQFTTWYDGSGGFIPGVAGGWRPLADDELELDRGEVWVEGGLRMEDIPEITLRYSHQWRDGQKDSTIWGAAFPGGLQRGFTPGVYDMDETRDVVTLDVAHTLGNTDLGLGLRYEGVRNDNTRSTTSANNTDTVFTQLSQREVYEYDLYGGHITSETRFGERMMLSFAYAHTTMDTKVDGGQRGNTNLGTGVFTPVYNLLTGGGDYSSNTSTLNFWWNPIDDLVVIPSLRGSWEDISMLANRFDTVAATNTGVPTSTRTNDDDLKNITESLEIRYNGIENLVLYTSAEWTQGDSDRWLRNPANGHFRFTQTDIDDARYSIGANWYPLRKLSFSAKAGIRTFDEDFGHQLNGTTFDAQLAQHNVESENINLRMTWRAMPNLTLVTRYDYQQSEIENQAYTDAAAAVPTLLTESADINRHVVSQSATWNATENFYLQASLHWTSAETSSPGDRSQPGYHVKWDDDYLSGTLGCGYALSKSTELNATYYYLNADNYVNNSLLTTPYGFDGEEHALTVGMTHWINRNMAWNLRYGFFKGTDGSTGGNSNYDAHMVSTGLRVRF
jgi:hypothetical protein